jgi:hypothetical protein
MNTLSALIQTQVKRFLISAWVSGTTGVACVQTGREFIGIEKYPLPNQPIHPTENPNYFEIASRRIAQAPQPLFIEPPRQPTQREPDKGNVTLNLEGFE